jgi:hypothetical protein
MPLRRPTLFARGRDEVVLKDDVTPPAEKIGDVDSELKTSEAVSGDRDDAYATPTSPNAANRSASRYCVPNEPLYVCVVVRVSMVAGGIRIGMPGMPGIPAGSGGKLNSLVNDERRYAARGATYARTRAHCATVTSTLTPTPNVRPDVDDEPPTNRKTSAPASGVSASVHDDEKVVSVRIATRSATCQSTPTALGYPIVNPTLRSSCAEALATEAKHKQTANATRIRTYALAVLRRLISENLRTARSKRSCSGLR